MNKKYNKAIIAVAVAIVIFLCGYFLSVTKGINISVKVNGGAPAANFTQAQVTETVAAEVASVTTEAASAVKADRSPVNQSQQKKPKAHQHRLTHRA